MPVTFVRNENDVAIHPGLVDDMIKRWTEIGAQVETLLFPVELGIDHDIIDIYQTNQRVDVVYPQLYGLLIGEPFIPSVP